MRIGFKCHHSREMFLRDALVVAGVVGRGESVFLTAEGSQNLGEFSDGLLRTLEHQVLEKMGDAGNRRLVGRSRPCTRPWVTTGRGGRE